MQLVSLGLLLVKGIVILIRNSAHTELLRSLGVSEMPLFVARLPNLTIPNGAAVSNIWNSNVVYEDSEGLMLAGINVTDGVITYVIQVCDDPAATAASTWFNLNTGAADVAPPVQGKAIIYTPSLHEWLATAGSIRIQASANVTANRSWAASKQFRAP